MELRLRDCFKHAVGRTNWKGMAAKEVGIGILVVAIGFAIFSKDDAMSQFQQIALTALVALVAWPVIEFAWNFAASPFRILNDRLRAIDSSVANLKSAPVQSAPAFDSLPKPNYQIWGKRRELRIDQASLLIADMPPEGNMESHASREFRSLLMEATSAGHIALGNAMSPRRTNYWGPQAGVHIHSRITMASLISYLERESLAPEFLERIKPHVAG